MRILVVGAGGIGGYFGARLLEAGCDVTFLLRARRAAQISATGLVVRSPHGNMSFRAPPHVVEGAITSPFDLVIIACKAYDLDQVIDSIAPAVGPSTAILPLLNGMRHLDVLSARFGKHAVLAGHCMISAALDADGNIEHFSDLHVLTFGELNGERTPRVEQISAEFARGKFVTNASTEVLQEMWEKWVFIAALGCINCLLRAPVGDVVRAGAGDIALALFEECCDVGRANGFAPRAASIERAQSIILAPDSLISASMFKDVEAGRPTEAEHIVGDLVARGNVAPRSLLAVAYAHLRVNSVRRARELR